MRCKFFGCKKPQGATIIGLGTIAYPSFPLLAYRLPWGSALLRLSFGSTDTSTVPWGLEDFSKSTSLCFGALGLKGLALKPVKVSRRDPSCIATDTSTLPWGLEDLSKSSALWIGFLGLKGLAQKAVTVS